MKAVTMIFVFLVCGVLGLIGVSAIEIIMNETVLGTNSDVGNLVKTIDVAYDGDANMVYVAGTLTGGIIALSFYKEHFPFIFMWIDLLSTQTIHLGPYKGTVAFVEVNYCKDSKIPAVHGIYGE